MNTLRQFKSLLPHILVISMSATGTSAYAANSALMDLLKVLRNKGTLTHQEYDLLVNAARDEESINAKAVPTEEARKDVEKQVANATIKLPEITTKDKIVFQSSDGGFKWQPIGRVFVDYNGINSDTDGAELGSGWELRRARLGMDVTLGKNWTGKFEADFGSTSQKVSVKDAWIGYKEKTSYGDWWIKLGQQHIPFGWDTLSSSKYMTFINRAAYADGVLQRARHLGLGAFTRSAGGRWTLHAGVFGGTVSEDPDACGATDGECDEQWNIAARLTGVPFMADKRHLLHLGAGLWSRDMRGSTLSLSQRHGVFHVIDSKPWALGFGTDADDVFAYNLESVGILGPTYFKAEFVNWDVDPDRGSGFTDNVDLNGWSVEGGWFLTGESKNYNFKKAQFGSLKPKAIVGQGGRGAWEVGIRYENLDLNDPGAGALGGEGDLLTIAVNWYLNNTMRLMANYKKVLDFDCTGGSGDCLRLNGDESSAFLLRGQIYW